MDSITVNKQNLIETLKTNRDEHQAIYAKAVLAYKARYVEEAKRFADEAVRSAAIGARFVAFNYPPVPEEHTDDFDRAIQMLEWDLSDTVDLSTHEFAQYVQNNWGWAKTFTSNTVSYTGGR